MRITSESIIDALKNLSALPACSRCQNDSYTAAPGFIKAFVFEESSDVIKVRNINKHISIPSVAVICDKCGAIYYHSAVKLGLFRKEV